MPELEIISVAESLRFAAPLLFVLVGGGEEDGLIRAEVGRMTTAWYGTEAAILSGLGHALMLDRRWDSAARYILRWLKATAARSGQAVKARPRAAARPVPSEPDFRC